MNKATPETTQHSGGGLRPKLRNAGEQRRWVTSDFLILSDGTVLAHNLTPAMAAILKRVNPRDAGMRKRASVLSKPAARAAKRGANPKPAVL
jgi:hypothetical protein